ncbi:MAG: homoserine dehydrogenase [Thermoproteus sp.]|nr:MAG: homoserine dehydrogenase [Thermoproteus sp. CIS_19]
MLILYGFGGVGRTLVEVVRSRTDLKISAVFDSRGGVLKCGGFEKPEIEALLRSPRGGVSRSGVGSPAALEEAFRCAEVLVDVSPPNYADGEPAVAVYRSALKAGLSIVTANKAPLALRFQEFEGKPIYYKATVMAGTPVVDLALGLRGQRPLGIRGILNGTTNYILSRVDLDGLSFADALEEAKAKGYVEPDPAIDLEGLDAAAKLVILANALGVGLSLGQVRREPLRYLGPRTKYVAEADLERGTARVSPIQLGPDDPLLSARYSTNAVEITTEVNEVRVYGKGAGRLETSLALLNDVLRAARERRCR